MLSTLRLKNVYPIEDEQTFSFCAGVNFFVGESGAKSIFKTVEQCVKGESLLQPVNKDNASVVVCEFKSPSSEEKCLTEYRCQFNLNGDKPVAFILCLQVLKGSKKCSLHTFNELTRQNGDVKRRNLFLPEHDLASVVKYLQANSIEDIVSLMKANGMKYVDREDSRDYMTSKEMVQILKYCCQGLILIGCSGSHLKLNMNANCFANQQTKFVRSFTKIEKEEAKEVVSILTDLDIQTADLGEDITDIFVSNDRANTTSMFYPEGFPVAKTFAALFASSCVHTIYMEQPEREMHPSIIQRLKDFIYPKLMSKKKSLIISTHSPLLISPADCSNTFIFKRKTKGTFTERVIAWSEFISEKEGLKIPITETFLPNLFFKHKVFFVEGTHDRIFFKSLLTKIVEEDNDVKRLLDIMKDDVPTDLEILKRFVISLDILQMDGATHIRKFNNICQVLEMPRYFLLSKDAVFENGESLKLQEKFGLQENLKNDSYDAVEKRLREEGVFVWNKGSLEDSIRALIPDFPTDSIVAPDKKRLRLSDGNRSISVNCSNDDATIRGHFPSQSNEEMSLTERLMKENIVIPIARKGKLKARHKLYANKRITTENINNSMKIFLQCCRSLDDDLVQLIRFLLQCANKECNTCRTVLPAAMASNDIVEDEEV